MTEKTGLDTEKSMRLLVCSLGVCLKPNELDAARLAQLFPGLVYKINRNLKVKSSIDSLLSADIFERVPKPLRFLDVAALRAS